MYLPPLHPISNSDFYVSGNVVIHPSAAIAPGVLLQADPESQIIIASGVCIGMGAILHAYQGRLEVQEGVNIGAGVLIVGKGKIGTHACIGSATTILNPSIGRGEVVSPGSLIGDTSRQASETPRPETTNTLVLDSSSNQQGLSENQSIKDSATLASEPSSNQPEPELSGTSSTPVYGQANLNRLLSTLLPYRQALNNPIQDDQSPPNSS
jgi:carbon dioxide concentrating mechanism protein CcmN